MDFALLARARAWRDADPDPETAREVDRLLAEGEEAGLLDRFRGELEFGTAGLRGLLGAGPNRMNRAVVRRATAGVARHLLASVPDAARRGVVVARDARRGSDDFALETAGVLAGHGIRVHFFVDLAPTPLGAFAVKELGAAAGVVVTASHNPPAYNGYKVYWDNAAQIVPPVDAGIAAAIATSGPANAIPFLPRAEAEARGLFVPLGDDLCLRYHEAISGLVLHPGDGRDLGIVYTAMHGVGARFTLEALRRSGFANVHPVPAQNAPDGAFPTVAFPNPEEPGALDLALALCEETKADLLLANDPDADRLAAGARDRDGRMRLFSGNELGVLLGAYSLTWRTPRPARPLVLTTIVSSSQLGVIARDLGAAYAETLTGFKWIENRALELEQSEGRTTVFGYEEALGYSVADVVRDKDGISAALVFADLAGWCRARGVTAWGYLEEIQRAHGLFLSAQKSVTIPGAEGAATIAAVMDGFRARPPAAIGGLLVVETRDYRAGVAGLPASNVVAYLLEGGSRVTLRPSGTEPKIKYYFELRETPGEGEELSAAKARGDERLASLVADFVRLALERGQPG
ncbi:MAG: phospho-sugar mutase [Holophagales bacterium]|nr:phospho-sugar mutase [Holophagales bacterium]